VPARHLHDAWAETLARDAALKVDREEPVVASGQDGRRHLGPRRERVRLVERDVGLLTSVLAAVVPPTGCSTGPLTQHTCFSSTACTSSALGRDGSRASLSCGERCLGLDRPAPGPRHQRGPPLRRPFGRRSRVPHGPAFAKSRARRHGRRRRHAQTCIQKLEVSRAPPRETRLSPWLSGKDSPAGTTAP
jgi:hypothetical protein